MSTATAEEGLLRGRKVAVTGRLASMTRAEVVALIERAHGAYAKGVEEDTDFLVVGQEGWPLRNDGHLTQALNRARELQKDGGEIVILPEGEFLQRLGLGDRQDGIRRLYTSEQLGRILGVPGPVLRSWVRNRLIRPIKTVRRLCYFDFEQVASAKVLNELWRGGATAERIRSSLGLLQRWMPGAEKSLAQLDMLEEGGQLLVRLQDGRMAEPDGQLFLGFPEVESDDEQRPTRRLIHDWFEEALRLEDRGELDDASEAYHKSLLHGEQRPEAAFNLGNVLYALERKDASSQRYMQAVELDPEYVEAWNNLGNVLSELGRWGPAVQAFQRALLLEPQYADAHYNLGECLHHMGQTDDARHHWREYLKQDPHSSWARKVRDRLQETER